MNKLIALINDHFFKIYFRNLETDDLFKIYGIIQQDVIILYWSLSTNTAIRVNIFKYMENKKNTIHNTN